MAVVDAAVIKEHHDCRDIVGRFTELQRASGQEMAGPCPKCGGSDRFHVTDAWFFCRRCHEKRGDAIELLIWLGLADGFKDALVLPLAFAVATGRKSDDPEKQFRAKLIEAFDDHKILAKAVDTVEAMLLSGEGKSTTEG